MTFDLSTAYTRDDVAALLGSGDDSTATQLRVSTNGIAYLSKDVASSNLTGVALRLETWSPGAEHVGPSAARDSEWVNRIFNALNNHWPNPKSPYVDNF